MKLDRLKKACAVERNLYFVEVHTSTPYNGPLQDQPDPTNSYSFMVWSIPDNKIIGGLIKATLSGFTTSNEVVTGLRLRSYGFPASNEVCAIIPNAMLMHENNDGIGCYTSSEKLLKLIQ